MTNDDESRREIISLGGVSMMCQLLSSKSPQVLKNACGALLNLANEQESWEDLRDGVPSLLKIIENEKDVSREYALGVFVNLTNDPETLEILKKNRGVKIIGRMLTQNSDELTRCAIGTFGTLARDQEICRQMRDLDIYELIVAALDSLDEDILGRTSGCLWNMAVDGEESKKELIKVGAHEKACKLIKKSQDPEIYGNLAMFLSILGENDAVSETIRDSGAIKYIVKGIGSDDEQIRGNCIAAVWNLGHVVENREPMRELGITHGMIDLMTTKREDVLWKTLGALITIGGNEGIAKEMKENQGIPLLVSMIQDESQPRICLYSVLSLAVLAYSDSIKDEIREVDGITPLINLLASKNETMIEKVLCAMLNLSLNAENRTAFRQLDGIAPLIELLYHTNPNIQQNAAGVLWNLSNDEKNKKLIRELGGLNALLTLIGGGKLEPMKKKVPRAKDRVAEVDETRDEVLQSLEDLAKYVKKRLANELDPIHKLDAVDVRKVKDAADKTIDWLSKNPNSTKKQIDEKMKELDSVVRPILDRCDAKEQLDQCINDIKERMKNPNVVSRLKADDVKLIEKEIKDAKQWSKDNAKAPAQEINNRRADFEKKIRPPLEKAEAQDILETYARDLKNRLADENDIGGTISEKDKRVVKNAINDALDFLEDKPNATRQEALDKKKELETKVNPIIAKEEAKKELENLLYKIQDRLKHDDKLVSRLTPEEKRKFEKLAKDIAEWSKKNPDASEKEIRAKIKELDDQIQTAFDRVDAMNALSDQVKSVRQKLDKEMKGLTLDEKKLVDKTVKDTERWIDSNPTAEKKKIDQKRDEFVNIVDPIVKRAEARTELSDYANDVRDRIAKDKKLESRIPKSDLSTIDTETKNALEWLKKNGNSASPDDILQKKMDLQDKIQPIMNRAEVTKDLVHAINLLEKDLVSNDNLTTEERNRLKDEIAKLKTWLDKNPNASRKEVDEKQQALDDLVNQIFQRAQVRKDLKEYTNGLKQRMLDDKEMTRNLAPEEKKIVERKTDEVLTFLEKTKEPKVTELVRLSEDLKETIEPIFENAKARGNLETYALDLKTRTKDIQKDLTKDQLSGLENAITHALDFLKKNPTANQTQVLVEKKKLENTATPLFETAKTNLADRVKLENLAKNIQAQLESSQQLKNLDQTKRDAIRKLGLEAEEWLRQHPNATEQEIRDYMAGLYSRLGDHTNFKFSVWVVANYGLGYGFSEALKWGKGYDPKKNDTKYVSSYLTPKSNTVVVHASSNEKPEWGKELKSGAVSDIKNRFQKQISKEEQELEKKFAEMKLKTGVNKTVDASNFSVRK